MNKVVEVTPADELTGNPYSLAITAPDAVHFVKGTSREEARFWTDVLSVFPSENKNRSSYHTRTGITEPGRGSGWQQVTAEQYLGLCAGRSVSTAAATSVSYLILPRHPFQLCRTIPKSYSPVVLGYRSANPAMPFGLLEERKARALPLRFVPAGRHKRNATFPGTQPSTKTNHILQTPPIRGNSSTNSEVVSRNQYNARISTPVWEGDDVFPTKDVPPKSSPIEQPPNQADTRKVYMGSPPTRDKADEKGRTRRVANREKRGLKTGRSFSEDISKMVPVWQSEKPSPPAVVSPTVPHHEVSHRLLMEEYESECKLKDIADSITRPRGRSLSSQHCLEPTRDSDLSSHRQIRGDPDGCGLDTSILRYSPSDLRIDLPAEELLNIKRGWLMKQGQDKEWTKHWFVLRGNGLLYYRDPKAEDQGILDGVIDLSGISSVNESQSQRNYGFQLTTWDGKVFTLSALTSGIRANWISAIQKAAGIQEQSSNLSSPVQDRGNVDSVVMPTPRSLLFSSDDEYRTASEGGRRESGEWGEALPPSPPLNRTPMSRVKERARGVSKWRGLGNKRSRSSPPNSRRSTLDSVSSQEMITASHLSSDSKVKDIVEDKTDYIFREKTFEKNTDDIKDKKRNADLVALERKVEDLVKREEESGRLRARDSAELELLKNRYSEDKDEWERALVNAENELDEANTRLSVTLNQFNDAKQLSERLASEVERLEARLASAIEENEALYAKLRPGSGRARSVDSLSDLTNIDLTLDLSRLDKDRMIEEYTDLRSRFEKAVSEIRALKRELRESQAQCDWLELSLVSARQEGISMKMEADASSNLMAARIQDLATKLSGAEKQIRTLKQKLAKTETREKRRSLSLKGRESFTICKELEEKLSELESKMSNIEIPASGIAKAVVAPAPKEIDTKGDRLRRTSLDSATSSEPLKVLLRLRNLEAKLAAAQESSNDGKQIELKLFNGECDEVDSGQKEEMVNEVKKMENLLRAKLIVLAKKKESLIKSGQWTNEAKLNLLAEKLAYESVLIGRLHDAVMESKSLDLTDAERLITGLDTKISGGKPNMETSLDYLVKSLAKHLTQQGVKRASRKVKERKKPDPIIAELLNKKNSLDAKVESYINSVVNKLAEAFAVESLADDAGLSKNNDCLQAAWSMAQEAVNQELIQAEISQVLSQCSETYHSYIENENQTRFSGIVKERANLEMWASLADENLKNDMNNAVKKLQNEYQKRLETLKKENNVPNRPTVEDEEKTRALLAQFVDVVAHKSLLDARVSVICNAEYSDVEGEQGALEESSLLSEIQFLYVKFCRELTQDSKDEERLKDVVERMAREVYVLARILNPSVEIMEKAEPGDTWIDTLCKKCEQLKERLVTLQKCADNSKECSSCTTLQEELLRLENHHASEIHELEIKQELEIAKLKEEFDEQKTNLIQHYREEEGKLIERNSKLERELETWETQCNLQTEDLRSAYNNLSSSSSGCEDEESMRKRYQAEIQHLKAVCEKGLVGMENSHRRQIQELQEKHERELRSLPLDAMRKAHEAEVQKEVAKFKAEYMNKMQSNHDITAIHKQHQAEMEEIKREILSLSDKYSIKCVESASLEDKLRIANQQLAHAHQHIMQLDARNRQLRAHLVAEANNDSLQRLQEHSVCFIDIDLASRSQQAHTKPSLNYRSLEPPPLLKAEVKRCPDNLSLCGMVSKRREEFERRFMSSCPDRRTLI
ncbi:unnamed protein product [Nezara viridula]|uniref:PH domain-containing protein n=1 Tax=Nezara viridula TaxID=85310 RepID=A0A9P0HLE1_NEZVI|nr:unnamed protein product [Nezara viridula]